MTMTTTTRRVPYQSLSEATRYIDADCRPVAPTAATAEIDREVCAELSCDSCGHAGLDYRPFTWTGPRYGNRRYYAFAVCPACGHCEEI